MPQGEHMVAAGLARDARILACLAREPMTVQQISAAINTCRSSVGMALKRMNEGARKVFICGHTERRKGRPQPIWSAGNMPNVEFVPNARPAPKISAAQRRQQILDLLRRRPQTVAELAESMHIVRARVVKYLGELRNAQPRQVHIAKFLHPSKFGRGGTWVPVYAIGNKPDAVLVIETPAQRHARLSLDLAYREDRRKERKVRYQIERLRKKPNHWASALGV